MGLLDKANKRQCFKVTLEDRDVFVRALRSDELRRIDNLDKTLQNDFFLGKALVTEQGTPEVIQGEEESDKDFSERVCNLMAAADVDSALTSRLINEVTKISRFNPETIAKN